MAEPRPLLRLGVSQCLLGERVRYDGDHRREPFVAERLGLIVEWEPVCPEFESGMGVPREPIVLSDDPADPRVLGTETGKDHTATLSEWSARRLSAVDLPALDGFVLKSRSPSCALQPVPVSRGGEAVGASAGLFARALQQADPTLPLCDEEDLRRAPGQGAFFLRAFSRRYARHLRTQLHRSEWARSPLWRRFFEAHALALLARGHDPDAVGRQCRSQSSSGDALDQLAHALGAPETTEGRRRAFTRAVEWMTELDRQHWCVLHPMLEEVERGSMQPEVLRLTLHSMAKSIPQARVADQLFLRPAWMGFDLVCETVRPPSAASKRPSSSRSATP